MKNSIEHILAKSLKAELIAYIEAHPKKVNELIQLAISNQPPHSARAAWLLSKVAKKEQVAIKQHITSIFQILPLVKDGQKRDLLNVLRHLDLSAEEEGILYNISVNIWTDLSKIPSARLNAFKFIMVVCKKYPELHKEFLLLTEDYYLASLSPGIKRVVHKMINRLVMILKK